MKCKRQVPRPWLSLAASKHPANHRTEAGYFPRDAPAHEEAMAVVVETKAGRNPQRPAGRHIPGENGRQVLRSIAKAKTVLVTQAAIHLGAANEVLRTQSTTLRGSLQSERPAGAEGVAEFPR